MANSLSSSTVGTEARLRWDPSLRHRVVVGAEARKVREADFRNEHEGTPIPPSIGDFPYHITSAYVQDEIQLASSLALTLGLRHDQYSRAGSATTPRAALVYHPGERNTFKLLYGSAFRAPNTVELNFQAPLYLSNQALDPERVRTVEAIWEAQVGSSSVFSLSFFEQHATDLIEQVVRSDVPSPYPGLFMLQWQNRGHVDSKGVEAEISKRFDTGIRTSVHYGFRRAENTSDDTPLSNFPEHSVQARFSSPLGQWFELGSDVLFESGRMTLTGLDTGSFWLADANLGTAPIRGISVSLRVTNLFDADYSLPGGSQHFADAIVQYGRRAQISVRGHW